MIQVNKGQQFPVQLTVMRTQDTVTTQFLLAGCLDLCFNAVGKQRQYALDGFTFKDNVLTATVNTAQLDEGVYTLTARGRYMGEWWRAVTVPLFEVVATGGVLPTETVAAQSTAVFSIHQEMTGALARIDALEQKPEGVTPADLTTLQNTLIAKITAAQAQATKDSVLYPKVNDLYQSLKDDTTEPIWSNAMAAVGCYVQQYSLDPLQAFYCAVYYEGEPSMMQPVPPTSWDDGSSGTDSDGSQYTVGYSKMESQKSVKIIRYTADSRLKDSTLYWAPQLCLKEWQWRYTTKTGYTGNYQSWYFPSMQVLDFGLYNYENITIPKYSSSQYGYFKGVKIIRCPSMIEANRNNILRSISGNWRALGDYYICDQDWR